MVRIDYLFKNSNVTSYIYKKAPKFNLLKGGEGFIDLAQTAVLRQKDIVADWVSISEIARMVVTDIAVKEGD